MFHDVGQFLLENNMKFEEKVRNELQHLAEISSWLRKEREFSFYGDIDFVPTERYTIEDAQRAIADAQVVVEVAGKIIR